MSNFWPSNDQLIEMAETTIICLYAALDSKGAGEADAVISALIKRIRDLETPQEARE